MRRREFIGVMTAVAAWPVVAHAQQASGTKRIAVLMGNTEEADKGRFTNFRQALKDLNWTEGRNLVLDVRFGGGDAPILAWGDMRIIPGFDAFGPKLAVQQPRPSLVRAPIADEDLACH